MNADKIILFDYNSNMVKFNKIARDLLKSCEASAAFKVKFVERCAEELKGCKFYGHFAQAENHQIQFSEKHDITDLTKLINEEKSFLSNEQEYNQLRELALSGNIHIYGGDFTKSATIKEVVEITKKEGYTFSAIFLSNMFEWMKNKKEDLKRSIALLAKSETLIIDAATSETAGLGLNVVYYKDPQSNELYDHQHLQTSTCQQKYPSALLLNIL